MRPTALRPIFALAASMAVCFAFAAGCASTAPAPATDSGIVRSETANITTFRPKGMADDEIDLKAYFESLGPDAIEWYQHVQTLANPYFEGRVNGSGGTVRAREYMEWYFRRNGLRPAFPAATESYGGAVDAALVSYRQPFEFQTRSRGSVDIRDPFLTVDGTGLRDGKDFVILGNSGSGSVSGPISFAGYAIEEGPGGYSSFDAGTDLSGRIVIMFRYEPLDASGASRWSEGDSSFSPKATIAAKMRALSERGATGILLVNPPECRDGRIGLESTARSTRFGRPMTIPVAQVTPETANHLLARAGADGNLLAWRQRADEGRVTTANFDDGPTVTLGATVDRSDARASIDAVNVGAVLPGRGALAGEYLVIGGHYDHNGYGWFGTEPTNGPLYPGADDNASGTAGMLVLAHKLSERYANAGPDESLRSVLFLAFDAEERGLHGSRRFSEQPTVEADRMTALLNMDMIGRLRANQISIMGTGTGEGLQAIVDREIAERKLTATVSSAGSGRSDDANFHRIGVPAMHFFTGMHDEYTTPEDRAYTVNPAGAAKVIDLIYGIAEELVTRPDRLVYVNPSAGGPRSGADRGYGSVRLGIRPGMGAELETGILVDAVTEGTGAAEAGIQSGDVLLAWNGTELETMRTLVEMLQEHKPGDVVTLKVRRGSETLDVPVKLTASSGGR